MLAETICRGRKSLLRGYAERLVKSVVDYPLSRALSYTEISPFFLFFAGEVVIFVMVILNLATMESVWIVIGVAVLLLVCGVAILMGRGDWLIAGYNPVKKVDKERYNLLRLRLLTGLFCIYVAIVDLVNYYIECDNFIAYALLPMAILVIILSNTWAKRK